MWLQGPSDATPAWRNDFWPKLTHGVCRIWFPAVHSRDLHGLARLPNTAPSCAPNSVESPKKSFRKDDAAVRSAFCGGDGGSECINATRRGGRVGYSRCRGVGDRSTFKQKQGRSSE